MNARLGLKLFVTSNCVTLAWNTRSSPATGATPPTQLPAVLKLPLTLPSQNLDAALAGAASASRAATAMGKAPASRDAVGRMQTVEEWVFIVAF